MLLLLLPFYLLFVVVTAVLIIIIIWSIEIVMSRLLGLTISGLSDLILFTFNN